MSAATKHPSSSSSKPPKSPTSQNPNRNPKVFTLSEEDLALSRATHLTRSELLRRRSRHLKQLSKCYKDHYWALMEELKIQYRAYYWKYGVSPFRDQQQHQEQKHSGDDNNNNNNSNNNLILEGSGENVNNNNSSNNNNYNSKGGVLDLKNNHRCLFVGCKLKAMALTSFCHLHILSDAKQRLYKPCDYVIKSAQAGPITCGKPILRSTVPSLCTVHFQKAQKHVTRALKKAGLNVSSSSKLAPKFHVIVAEYIHQIQTKRRIALKKSKSKVVIKEEG